MSSILDTDTILAVDVGSVSTRASLFDVVDGHFRLIASGRAPIGSRHLCGDGFSGAEGSNGTCGADAWSLHR